MALPRGICKTCGRSIAGRQAPIMVDKLVLRRHNKANKGTKAAGHGPAVQCPGSHSVVDGPGRKAKEAATEAE